MQLWLVVVSNLPLKKFSSISLRILHRMNLHNNRENPHRNSRPQLERSRSRRCWLRKTCCRIFWVRTNNSPSRSRTCSLIAFKISFPSCPGRSRTINQGHSRNRVMRLRVETKLRSPVALNSSSKRAKMHPIRQQKETNSIWLMLLHPHTKDHSVISRISYRKSSPLRLLIVERRSGSSHRDSLTRDPSQMLIWSMLTPYLHRFRIWFRKMIHEVIKSKWIIHNLLISLPRVLKSKSRKIIVMQRGVRMTVS